MKRNKSHTELRLIRFDLRVLCKMFTVVGVKGAFEIDDFLEVFEREIAKVLSEHMTAYDNIFLKEIR